MEDGSGVERNYKNYTYIIKTFTRHDRQCL